MSGQSSLFGDDPAASWNLNRLDTILNVIDLPGVTRAMLYFGMWRTMFAFHTVCHPRLWVLAWAELGPKGPSAGD